MDYLFLTSARFFNTVNSYFGYLRLLFLTMCDRLDVNSARVSVTFDSKAGLQNEHCSNTVEVAAISQECSK